MLFTLNETLRHFIHFVGSGLRYPFPDERLSVYTAWHRNTGTAVALWTLRVSRGRCWSLTIPLCKPSTSIYSSLQRWQTTADVRFRVPTLTPATYFLKMCGSQLYLQPSSSSL